MFLLNEEPGNITRDGGKMNLAWLSLHLKEISHFDRETTKKFLAVISSPIWHSNRTQESLEIVKRCDIVRFKG